MPNKVMLKRWWFGSGMLAVVAAIGLLIAQRHAPTSTYREVGPRTAVASTVPTPAAAQAALSRQPVPFIPNLGQWDGPFSHKARMGAMTVFLQERGWTFTLVERPQRPELDAFVPRTPQPEPAPEPARGVAVRMHFEGGAGPALPTEEQRLPGVHNYFLGNDPERWRSKVPLHDAVLLSGLYPGIDLRARTENGHFEYDLLVEPGADLTQVLVTVDGADGLRLDPDGTLIIDTILGPVRQPPPKTWQVTASGERQDVTCRYVLRGENTFGFDTSDWDPDLALVVDPGLVYSTYLGGSDSDGARLALDAAGAATAFGHTLSPNFPTTPGAFDTTYNGGGAFGGDAFVTRLDPSGGALVYSTFLGGSGSDSALDIALDATGAATVCGQTFSANFPVTAGAFDTTFNNVSIFDSDAFVTRLDPSGSVLVYSTYLGGSGDDNANDIALDAAGAATVCGYTVSPNFPTTAGAFDTTHNGSDEAFVTRLDPSGSSLIYSTYLGGSNIDAAWALALDATGAATVCGYSHSTNFPTSAGAFATSFNGGADAFVSRLDPSGSSLIYSTYLGGSNIDVAWALALDATGAATVGGYTGSPNFPATAGAFDTTFNGGLADAFVSRLDPSGSSLVYSTFLGGSGDDNANDIALDASGAATVCGRTNSGNFPVTQGAFDTSFNGGYNDAFITRLDPSASTLVYSTYLGGSDDDSAWALALDASGTATVCGGTASANFPVTAGAFDTTFNGGSSDAFITRLDLGTTIGLSQPGGPGTPITVDNGYLIPGNEYYNIFSLDLCPAGPGTGPYLGLCATTLPNVQFIVLQASLPVGSPPFHFVATASTASWGPYSVGPGTLDAVCLDVTGGVLGSYSPVTRITIQ